VKEKIAKIYSIYDMKGPRISSRILMIESIQQHDSDD